MLNQYSRAELLYGSDNMELLRGCRVAVHDYVIFLHTQYPSYLI